MVSAGRRRAVPMILTAGLAVGLVIAPSAQAAFPGTNGKIAFARDPDTPDSDSDIFTISPTGQDRVALTGAPDFEQHPSFSADGEMIAFDRFVGGGFENASIWVMSHSGTNQTRLTSGPSTQDDTEPGFSPDGRKIVFSRETPTVQNIFVMNSDGSGQTPLTSGDDFDAAPTFSPNGQRIAFQRLDSGSFSASP